MIQELIRGNSTTPPSSSLLFQGERNHTMMSMITSCGTTTTDHGSFFQPSPASVFHYPSSSISTFTPTSTVQPTAGGGGSSTENSNQHHNSTTTNNTSDPQQQQQQQQQQNLKCPRCDSTNTKFCYYNNYNLTQPRHFCKTCRRYWTKGGALRNVPIGGGCRKNRISTTGCSGATSPAAGKPSSSYNKTKVSFGGLSIADFNPSAAAYGGGGSAGGFLESELVSSNPQVFWSPPPPTQGSHILSLLRSSSSSSSSSSYTQNPNPNIHNYPNNSTAFTRDETASRTNTSNGDGSREVTTLDLGGPREPRHSNNINILSAGSGGTVSQILLGSRCGQQPYTSTSFQKENHHFAPAGDGQIGGLGEMLQKLRRNLDGGEPALVSSSRAATSLVTSSTSGNEFGCSFNSPPLCWSDLRAIPSRNTTNAAAYP